MRRPRRRRSSGSTALSAPGRSEFVQSVFGRRPRDRRPNIVWQGKPVSHPQRARSDEPWHRAGAGEPARSGSVPQSRRRLQHQPADFRPPDYRRPPDPSTRSEASPGMPTSKSANLQIKTAFAGLGQGLRALSGGNQQKIVIGKWLNHGAQAFHLSTSRPSASMSAPKRKFIGCSEGFWRKARESS